MNEHQGHWVEASCSRLLEQLSPRLDVEALCDLHGTRLVEMAPRSPLNKTPPWISPSRFPVSLVLCPLPLGSASRRTLVYTRHAIVAVCQDVNRDTLVFHADLLLKLGVDPAGLKERYLDAHRRQLQAFLSASRGALVEDYSVSLDACLGKLAEGFLPLLLRSVWMYVGDRNAPRPMATSVFTDIRRSPAQCRLDPLRKSCPRVSLAVSPLPVP